MRTISESLADTVSGAVIGQFTQTVSSFPARVTVSHRGYVTGDTWVNGTDPRLDLFPEAGFDLAFYRQFARGTMEGAAQPLRVLSQSPSIYLQTAGLSPAVIGAIEAAVREVVPAFSGGRLQVMAWEAGTEARAPRVGWVTVEHVSEPSGCGRANIGTVTGRIWLNVTNPLCSLPSVYLRSCHVNSINGWDGIPLVTASAHVHSPCLSDLSRVRASPKNR
jgi:hypothetical protein